MNIKLMSMTLNNFKGTEHYVLSANGNFVNVYGKNRSGKTTLADAFRWILFDKNSNDEKSFGIKTQSKIGLGVDHGVEMTISINGDELKLKKVYSEKWTKKRGMEDKEMTGHETAYWINDVPSSKGEYDSKIKSLIAEDVFKIITDVLYFNIQLKWQERRKILVDMAGDVTDQEVIKSKPELAQLIQVIEKHTMEDYSKIVKEKKKLINEELKKIPTRIDEANKSKPETPQLDKEALQELATMIRNKIAKASSEVGKIETTLEDFRNTTKELLRTKTELQKETDNIMAMHRSNQLKLETDKSKKERELETKINLLKDKVPQLQGKIDSAQTQKETIKLEFEKLKVMAFDESSTVCPTCQRGYEANKIEELKSNFNENRKNQSDDLKNKNAELNKIIEESTIGINNANDQIKLLNGELETEKSKLVINEPICCSSKQNELTLKVQELEAKIAAYSEGNKETDDTSEVDNLTAQIEEVNQDLQRWGTIETLTTRISELKDQEKTLSQEYARYEKAEYLTEQFIRTKVGLISEKINSMFSMVEWKLFEVQVNGGLNECCEATFNSVPYQDLNTEAKMNAGLDIINKLTQHFGVSAPIFIDNAEAVIDYLPTDSQLIKLYVADVEEMKVEVL